MLGGTLATTLAQPGRSHSRRVLMPWNSKDQWPIFKKLGRNKITAHGLLMRLSLKIVKLSPNTSPSVMPLTGRVPASKVETKVKGVPSLSRTSGLEDSSFKLRYDHETVNKKDDNEPLE